jgi:PIN domain nuclease of toxin-antitoxin system
MRVLLDTHTFLWWNTDAPQLSTKARQVIGGGADEIYVSAATAWELAIKARKGRLVLPLPPDEYVQERMNHYKFLALPVLISHACQVFHLPDHNADPFDRLLVAQCQIEEMALLSADEQIRFYPIQVIW